MVQVEDCTTLALLSRATYLQMVDQALVIGVLIWLLQRMRAIRMMICSFIAVLDQPHRITKRYRNYKKKMSKMKLRWSPPRFPRHQPPRDQGDIDTIDLFRRTGLEREEFDHIFELTENSLVKPRNYRSSRITKTSLSPRFRLLLALQFLRHYPKYSELAEFFHISASQVSREIHHILPKIRAHFTNIEWPPVWRPISCLGGWPVSGAIDCSSHFRNRVHPHQGDW